MLVALAVIVLSAKLYVLHVFSFEYFPLENHRQVAPAACLLGCSYLDGCNLQQRSFPVKCSTETSLFRVLQHVILGLVAIPGGRHFPAPLSYLAVQVNTSWMTGFDFELLF